MPVPEQDTALMYHRNKPSHGQSDTDMRTLSNDLSPPHASRPALLLGVGLASLWVAMGAMSPASAQEKASTGAAAMIEAVATPTGVAAATAPAAPAPENPVEQASPARSPSIAVIQARQVLDQLRPAPQVYTSNAGTSARFSSTPAPTPAPESAPATPQAAAQGSASSGNAASANPVVPAAAPASAPAIATGSTTPTSNTAAPLASASQPGVTQSPASPAPAAAPQSAALPTGTPLHTVKRPSGPLAPVAEALATLLAGQDTFSLSRAEREALVQFYAGRGYQPMFVEQTGLNVRGNAIVARLAAAGEDGLNPADYTFEPPLTHAPADALARSEVSLAAAGLTYARHAQSGRFIPSRISGFVTPTREIPDPAVILATLASAPDANAALAAFNPPHAGYLALRKLLAASDDDSPARRVTIPAGPLLQPGKMDSRVPALRARLGLSDPPENELTYDPELAEAVKAFQESVRLKPTGVVGDATVRTLNRRTGISDHATRDDVIANMERWRWLPRDLGAYHVTVNIPEYVVRIYDGDTVMHETRTVVGKAASATPLLSAKMTYAVVNPAWNIPPSIARNEMMPLLQNNPSALSRRNIEVKRSKSGGYSFRQMPGANNALGRVKFMFPNDHAVYLHDTPSRHLFANDKRAYSHGCVRVQKPFEFGSVLFNVAMGGENWSEERFSRMFSNKERYVTLKQPIPVHLVYFTLVADAQGRLTRFEDIYGINSAVKTRLGLTGKRHMAEGHLADGTTSRAR